MTTATLRLSSSLRVRSAEESLPLAASIALSRGISRVVDTTWLDCIGIPVYASIRPDGHKGSLCVHAGKGCTPAEAKIGAYMEAIEFSFAPHGSNAVDFRMVRPRDILDSFGGQLRFPDFAPRVGRQLQADDAIAAVTGQEISAGLGDVLVPAELVYHPFFDNPGVKLYGTSTNGLASGNTLQEATVHALAEVMERDVRSFELLDDRSRLVTTADAPPHIRQMLARVERAGLACHLRYSENPFGLPYCSAYILEPDEHAPLSVAMGFGLHPDRNIAAVRALAEAVQGRLTNIHGGRDDLMKRRRMNDALGRARELELLRLLRRQADRPDGALRFSELPHVAVASIAQAQQCLFERLRGAGMRHVVRIALTPPGYPFQVVKVVVPGAELYEHELKRVGPRLLGHFKRQRHAQG